MENKNKEQGIEPIIKQCLYKGLTAQMPECLECSPSYSSTCQSYHPVQMPLPHVSPILDFDKPMVEDGPAKKYIDELVQRMQEYRRLRER